MMCNDAVLAQGGGGRRSEIQHLVDGRDATVVSHGMASVIAPGGVRSGRPLSERDTSEAGAAANGERPSR